MRVELFGDDVEAIRYVDPTTGEILQSLDAISIYQAGTQRGLYRRIVARRDHRIPVRNVRPAEPYPVGRRGRMYRHAYRSARVKANASKADQRF